MTKLGVNVAKVALSCHQLKFRVQTSKYLFLSLTSKQLSDT